MEFWTSLVSPVESPDPRRIVDRAKMAEADGWSGAFMPDSQISAPEAFGLLTWCASATSTLKLGTGTSNPATRHPSVLASWSAFLQVVSEGRVTLSIGRGDSALAFVGVPPVPPDYFEQALALVQSYLRGETPSTARAASFLGELNRGFGGLSVGVVPDEAGLAWLPDDYVRPEVEVAATGPKAIAMGARHADRISFALGADLGKLRWAVDTAHAEADRIGRDPSTLTFGAYVPFYPHRDPEVSRQLAQGLTAAISRFSAMHKTVASSVPVTDRDKQNLERVIANYSMNDHGSAGQHSQSLDADYIDDFALVGDPSRCIERILAIQELGVERLMLWTSAADGQAMESYRLAVEEVLPTVGKRG